MISSNVNVNRELDNSDCSKSKLKSNQIPTRPGSISSKMNKPMTAVPISKAKSNRLHEKLTELKRLRAGNASDNTVKGSFMGTFGSNPTGASKELVFKCYDFFDFSSSTATAVHQYKFAANNFNIAPPSDTATPGVVPDANVGKIISVKLWALPQFAIDTSSSLYEVLFGVPVCNYGETTVVGNPITGIDQESFRGTAGQCTTVLTPTSVSDWVLCGSYTSKSLFKDSNFSPVFDDGSGQALFTYAVVNPDDGQQVSENTSIQFMVEVEIAQALPVLASVQAVEFAGTS